MSAIQPLPQANVRSQSYYVARKDARCWRCGISTRLLALAVPDRHETLDGDSPHSPDGWQRAKFTAFLFYVEHLPESVQTRLNRLSRHFRPGHSTATLCSYWANHCEHCDVLLEDHELHCEPDGAFLPLSEAAAANIVLLQIHEPFEAAAAGYAFEPEFFRFMRMS
jgi:hypothetical protein